jgi:hypothetical protein
VIWALVASGFLFSGEGFVPELPGGFLWTLGGGTGVGIGAGANGVGVGTGRNFCVVTGGVGNGVGFAVAASLVGGLWWIPLTLSSDPSVSTACKSGDGKGVGITSGAWAPDGFGAAGL